ncbi:MAG: hypothetical protein QOH62_3939 [Solirubrobacteraceae bacterium]|nr:hypothetical protein [Solirubrobacteraceae bacterium]
MSARSIRRAQARRAAQEHRRALLRRRRAMAAGALGAAALMAAPAHAATWEVANTDDSGTGSLRQAILDANGNGNADTITFAPGLSGVIALTSGALSITENQDLTITGPGRDVLAISGDANGDDVGDSQIFNIGTPQGNTVAISGLTLTRGFVSGGNGGAINDSGGAALAISDSAITNSTSDQNGGGIYAGGDLTLSASTISGNVAVNGGGVSASSTGKYSNGSVDTISDSTISHNQATGTASYNGGGGIYQEGSTLTLARSTISGNTATSSGGGLLANPMYGLTVDASSVKGNAAAHGGGMALRAGTSKYAPVRVTESTVSGNQGTYGAGLEVAYVASGNPVTIARSTISGNDGGANSWGGGILFNGGIGGSARLVDSTVSGNTATAGAGISLGSDNNSPLLDSYSGKTTGSIDFDNSTIAGNAATAHGGGIYLSQYDSGSPSVKVSGTAGITSTIVAGNTAAGTGQDLDRVDTSTTGGFDGAFSLVQAPGDAPLTQQAMLTGIDPQLGSLGDNGGPTATMLPAGTSPVIDQGRSPAKLKVDQRNLDRLVDSGLPNAAGGDGTDIGAVELRADQVVLPPLPPPPAKATFAVTVRGTSITPGTPLLPASSTPLDCAVTVVTMTSCSIEIRSAAATRLSKKTTIPKGALLAEGVGTATSGTTKLSLKVKLTGDGKALLKARPVGVDAGVAATAATDATSALTTTGKVHLLAGPSVTLPLGKRAPTLSKTVNKQLDQLAKLIPAAKTVSCTAYSDKGKADVTLTNKQAKAACARLVKDAIKGKVTSTGKGHAKPVASNSTASGRKANRRVIIRFTL